jgi:hexokinase
LCVKSLIKAARDRAAKLCAAGIAALYERINPAPDEPVAIGIDGSLYRLCTGFKDAVRANLELLLAKERADMVRLHEVDDGSGQGAVICCAALEVPSPASNRNRF